MSPTSTEPAKTLDHLTESLKEPRNREAAAYIAKTARTGHWSYKQNHSAELERKVATRNACGAELRITAAEFPETKSAEDFDFTAKTPNTHTDYAESLHTPADQELGIDKTPQIS